MLNIIKADLYRIFRGKGVYIAMIVLIAFTVLQAVSVGQGTIGVDTERMQHPEYWSEIEDETGAITKMYTPPIVDPTGKNIAFLLAPGMSNTIYFILPFIVFIAGADFSAGAVKNLLAGGSSRTKYFLAKLISTAAICIIVTLIYLILPIVINTIRYEFGGNFDMNFIKNITKIYLPQLYILFAFACIGLFLAFTFKRAAVLNTVYIAFSFVPILIIMIISDRFEALSEKLIQYELTFIMQSIGYYNGAMPPDITRALLIGGVYILACTIGGILLFRKAEIK